MQLTASGHLPRIGGIRVLDAQCDVALQLAIEPFAHLAGGDELPFLPSEGRVVHDHVDGNRRLLYGDSLEAIGMLDVRDGEADLDPLEPGETDDFAGVGRLELDAL